MVTAHFHDFASASGARIGATIASGRTPVLQFREMPTPAEIERANGFCREFGAAVQLRFFGFGWRVFDTMLLHDLPDAANLSIDTIRAITDFAPIASLPKLTRLRFGVHEHPDGRFLDALDLPRFTHLTLAENKRRNFDLAPLAAAAALEQLFVQGHHRNINTIAGLPRLADVSLSGFPKRHDLAFLNDLKPLRSLLLILGSRASIAEFAHAELAKLRIVWVRQLEDLGPLRRFTGLEELAIEDQLRLTSLDLSGLDLRRLTITNCKNLREIIGLEAQTRLEHCLVRGTRVADDARERRGRDDGGACYD
jgi:hypothetical protein